MPYIVRLFVLAPHGELEISKEFFEEIKEANRCFPKLVAVEEKFDSLMENFVELEGTVLTLGARHLAFNDVDITDLIEPRNLVSRLIANFLSSTRLYRDSLPQHVQHITGRADAAGAAFIKGIKSKSHPMTYRMVEAFRNYVQHRELLLSDIVFRSSREGKMEFKATAFSYWLEPLIDALEISKGRDVDEDVATELAKLGSKVNPMPLLRQYVEYLGSIHGRFHELIKERENGWERSHANARDQYKREYPEQSIISLGACFKDERGIASDIQYTSEDRANYRRYLRKKHLTAANFSKRYVKWSPWPHATADITEPCGASSN